MDIERLKGSKKETKSIYNIIEQPDGRFGVVFPGLIFDENFTVGTQEKFFDTREEAEDAIEQSRKHVSEMQEQKGLEKYYSHFYRIEKTADGNFEVTVPGFKHESGYYFGTTKVAFSSWSEARDYFLEKQKEHENLSKQPLLEIESGEGWERELFTFVTSFLEGEGKSLIQDLNIKKFDALTPRQAIEITLRVILQFTKYKESDISSASHDQPKSKTTADQKSTIELLREGMRKKEDPRWEGNGICRNFASMTKAVFEALKAQQGKFSRLKNTYALYEADFESFDPKVAEDDFLTMKATRDEKIGHAWNMFATVSEQGVNAIVLDTTWGDVNLETGEIENVDYTLTRMEPVVYALTGDLSPGEKNKQQIEDILRYYAFKADRPGGVEAVRTKEGMLDQRRTPAQVEETRFFTKRAWNIVKKHGVTEVPPELVPFLDKEFLEHTDELGFEDVEHIDAIKKKTLGFHVLDIYKRYFGQKSLRSGRDFLFRNDGLQRMAFEYMKERKDFQSFSGNTPEFRVRLREVVPEFFVDFDPATRRADAQELKYLLEQNPKLRNLSIRVSVASADLEMLKRIYVRVDEMLRSINPERYDRLHFNTYSGYDAVKNFDSLAVELSEK